MRRFGHWIGCALWLVALAGVGGASEPTAAPERHSVWKVQGEKCAVHLLGSVHVLKAEHYPLPAAFENAFSNASLIYFETDIGAMLKPETQSKLAMRAALPEGQTLKDSLSEQTYGGLSQHLKASGIATAAVDRFKPGFVVMTLAMIELRKQGFNPESGMDLHYFKRAEPERKTVRGLEPLDFQINLICDLRREEGEALMKSTLVDLQHARDKFGALITAWQTGDSASMEKLLNQAQKEDPAIMKKFLTDRNRQWVPQIEALVRGTNNAVVIVGAGHLVGQEGIVELLRQKGCKITQE